MILSLYIHTHVGKNSEETTNFTTYACTSKKKKEKKKEDTCNGREKHDEERETYKYFTTNLLKLLKLILNSKKM